MSYDITYDSEQEYITVTFTGTISVPIVRKYLDALRPVLEETECTRLLSDCREASFTLTSTDIMQFPGAAAESPLTARLKRAVVGSPGTGGFELYEILSKVMGQDVRVFKTREEAMEWLMVPAPDPAEEEAG